MYECVLCACVSKHVICMILTHEGEIEIKIGRHILGGSNMTRTDFFF